MSEAEIISQFDSCNTWSRVAGLDEKVDIGVPVWRLNDVSVGLCIELDFHTGWEEGGRLRP